LDIAGPSVERRQPSGNPKGVLILKVEPSARLSEQRAALASPKID